MKIAKESSRMRENMLHGNAARSVAWNLISEAGRGTEAKGWVDSHLSRPGGLALYHAVRPCWAPNVTFRQRVGGKP